MKTDQEIQDLWHTCNQDIFAFAKVLQAPRKMVMLTEEDISQIYEDCDAMLRPFSIAIQRAFAEKNGATTC